MGICQCFQRLARSRSVTVKLAKTAIDIHIYMRMKINHRRQIWDILVRLQNFYTYFCDSSLINIALDMKNTKNTCICRKSTSWVAVVEFDRYINKNAKLDEILGGAYLYLLLKINELRVMLGFLTLTNLLHPRGEKWAYSGLVLSFCSKSFFLRSSLAIHKSSIWTMRSNNVSIGYNWVEFSGGGCFGICSKRMRRVKLDTGCFI